MLILKHVTKLHLRLQLGLVAWLIINILLTRNSVGEQKRSTVRF